MNFAVVSRHATRIDVCIFDADGEEELYRFALPERLGDIHYGFVAGLEAGARYGFRAEGPRDAAAGHRFDASKLLVDPYAISLDRPFHHFPELMQPDFDTASMVPKAIVTVPPAEAPRLPPVAPKVIYELQVKAFTKLHPQVPEQRRGTVAALAEPAVIAHFKRLGIDCIELMPLAAWIDERHLEDLSLSNAWGYNPVTFMAPDPRLAPGGFAEIRDTVAKLHDAGIRVILDVVLNHTGESDADGATLSLRGLDNALYFANIDGALVNDSGCGNTLACYNAAVVRLAMDSLRLWANATGIDGFRFDLATVLGRTAQGFTTDAPLLAAIEQDPLLSRLTMIAEPWDIGPGGYRLGQFPARWREWNDRYRDDVRRFWRGDHGSINALATRLAGSSDLFGNRRPSCSINFAAAHDGFTLKDTVTYTTKNNAANGEDNRDGNGSEITWPGGDARALLATLFLSRGLPMLTAGDEFGRTQAGNNNAYAQDNATTWLDWAHADDKLIDFVAALIRLRTEFPMIGSERFLAGEVDPLTRLRDAEWLGAGGGPIDWSDGAARVLGLVLAQQGARIAIWINGSDATVAMAARARDGHRWAKRFSSAAGDDLPPHSVSLFVEEAIATTGISDATLAELAEAAGIERDWWEVDGTHHVVTPESLRAVLAALRIPHGSPADAREQLLKLRSQRTPLVVPAGTLAVLGDAAPRKGRFILTPEDGQSRIIEAAAGDAPRATLAPGYYQIAPERGEAEARFVIATPGRCYLPDDIAAGRKVFGLASHLYALRHKGDGGIGDFETLRRFSRLTEDTDGRLAGINPLHHLFPADRDRASPYQPSDRRFIDPLYISISQLLDDLPLPRTRQLAGTRRAAFAKLKKLQFIDYPAVWKAKAELLESAFAEFNPPVEFSAFIRESGEALARHGAFEAQAAGEPQTTERIRYRAFLQWLAGRQLQRAGDALYRDLALGCAFDGGEIADGGELFAGSVSLGAPPDPFSAAGQVWNLPPMSPLSLAEADFAPLRFLLARNMQHAAALRIDHILGFMRQFWVPRGSPGSAGAYVRFPLAAMVAIAAVESQRARCMVVGEDLGTIPDGLRETLAAADILSYRVLWFEREGTGFKAPASYPAKALACLGSHDLPTFMGWRRGRDIEIDRDLGLIDADAAATRRAARLDEIDALDSLAGSVGAGDTAASIAAHGLVAGAASVVMMVQADDLAGETEPQNVPGTDRERPNWRRRIAVDVDALADGSLAAGIVARVKKERP